MPHPILFASCVVTSATDGGLELGFVDTYDLTYADHGTGSSEDLSTWQANTHCPTFAWKRVGDFAQKDYATPAQNNWFLAVRATAADPDALARPTSMALNWNNKETANTTHGSLDGGLYTPVCPTGYVALGSVGTYHKILESDPTPADFPDLACVRERYTVPLGAANLTQVWNDHGSGIAMAGSVWTQPPLTEGVNATVSMPMWAGQDSYDAPAGGHTLDGRNAGLALVGYVATCDAPAPTPALTPPPPPPGTPQQVHIALGHTPATMGVQWATYGDGGKARALVQWAESAAAVSSAPQLPGASFAFTADSGRTWYNHVANMTGLAPVTRYFYRVGDPATGGWSQIFHFKSQVTPGTLAASLPQHHIVFGDMGSKCAFTICGSCTCDLVCDATTCANNNSLGLVAEVGKATHMLHLGDFGYNLGDAGGTVGDQFFRNIEQLAAYTPYMVSIGNHENGAIHLAHYTERFRLMPGNDPATPTQKTSNGVAPNNWWYSWDDGLIHYVAISTEIYFGVGPLGAAKAQFEWLKADLAKANANRANVPWIAVHGHRSVYCSCDGDCDSAAETLRVGTYGLEELFFQQGVDLFLNGHEHNYERNWPTYQNKTDQSNVEPKATIYIVTGAAGCSELHEPFTRPQPPRSAFRSNNFGYSRMIIHNHTHMRWQQVITDPGDKAGNPFFTGVEPYGTVIDDIWIVQSKHGPFSKADAPKSTALDAAKSVTIDHWEQRLRADMERNNTLQTVELIAGFREHYGQGQWLRTELKELDQFRKQFGEAAKWEDVSPDGSSDGHWDELGMVGP